MPRVQRHLKKKEPEKKKNGERLWMWILRILGIAGIAWETLVDDHNKPALLILFAGMIGLGSIAKLVGRGNGSVDKTT